PHALLVFPCVLHTRTLYICRSSHSSSLSTPRPQLSTLFPYTTLFRSLHRLSEGEKGRFMSEDRADFFRSLFGLEGWRLDALMVSDGCAAMVFGYSDPSGYYLYNSAFDPEHSEGSPGVVLLGSMIEQAIAEGMPRFDFLKG